MDASPGTPKRPRQNTSNVLDHFRIVGDKKY